MAELHREDHHALWENELDRAHRLSGEPPHRSYIKSGLAPQPRPRSPTRPGGPYPRRPIKPYRPTRPATPKPFSPYTPKRKPFGQRIPPLKPYTPALTPRGLGLLARFAKPLPLTVLLLLLEDFPWGRSSDPGYDMLGAGWSLYCDNGLGPLLKRTWANSNPGLPCGTGSQVPSGGAYGAPMTPAANIKWIAFGRSQLSGIRMRLDQQWVKPGGNSPVIPYYPNGLPGPMIQPPLIPWPALDPDSLPILNPAPAPLPVPYPLAPHRPGNPNPRNRPRRAPRDRQRPDSRPSFTVRIDGRARVRQDPKPKPEPHILRKPTGREREKKYIIGVNGALRIAKLIGFITEFSDLLDVAWKSLPKEIRRNYIGANRVKKIAVLLQNLEHIEPGSFVALFISDQLEDAAFGKLGKIGGKAAGEAFKDLKGSVGFQTGPADTPPSPDVPGSGDWIDALDQWLSENIYEDTVGNTSWKGWF